MFCEKDPSLFIFHVGGMSENSTLKIQKKFIESTNYGIFTKTTIWQNKCSIMTYKYMHDFA